MGWFGKKNKEEDFDDDDDIELEKREAREGLRFKRKLRDINSENKKLRREPEKPWGIKERLIVLSVLVGTVFSSAMLLLSSYGFKVPNLPKLNFDLSSISFINPFRAQTVTIGKKNPTKSEKIIKDFEAKTKPLSGIYSFYLYDLVTNESFGLNENEEMVAASLIKLPVIYSFYEEVKKGNLKMDSVSREQIRLMGQKSDNKAFSQLRQKLGDDLIQKYINDLNLKNTDLIDNKTTPKEISEFFKKFWEYDTKTKNEIFGYLTDTIYEDYLPKGIPDDIKVIHKYGRETHVINDGGIIMSDRPFILILMTQNINDTEAIEILPQLSKLVFDAYSI